MLGIISSFAVFGLFNISCCFQREVPVAGPKASFGACKSSYRGAVTFGSSWTCSHSSRAVGW